jgi:hypothetical protein
MVKRDTITISIRIPAPLHDKGTKFARKKYGLGKCFSLLIIEALNEMMKKKEV